MDGVLGFRLAARGFHPSTGLYFLRLSVYISGSVIFTTSLDEAWGKVGLRSMVH